jgi:hypothetical protein
LEAADLLLDFGVSEHQLSAISISIGRIAGHSAGAGDQEFVGCCCAVCVNQDCTGYLLSVMRVSTMTCTR